MAVLIPLQRLDRIDWNFPQAGTSKGSIHGLHWFPGNFIPQIPATLIQLLSKPGELIADPFGGSGTVAVEASRLGRRAIYSDRISACVLIARGKLALLRGALKKERRAKILADLAFEQRCRSNLFGMNSEGSNPDLSGWYSPDTLAQLRYLWKLIEQAPFADDRIALTAIFSDVLFDCAAPGQTLTSTGLRRRHHWGWVADNVKPRALADYNAIGMFHDRVFFLDNELSMGDPFVTINVLQQDARSLAIKSESIDLIVTSPPYVSVIDYTHANRLLYLWMGWSMKYERDQEIGARYKRGRRSALTDYFMNMRLARDEMVRVLRSGSTCAIVIGESKRFPGTAQEVIRNFSEVMPIVWGPVRRFASRRRVSDRAAQQPEEFICIFKKP